MSYSFGQRRAKRLAFYLGLVTMTTPVAAARGQSSDIRQFPVPSDLDLAVGERLPSEHLLGDWSGLRPRLEASGVVLTPGIITESAGVVGGGVRQGADYAHSLNVQADIDLATLAGLPGLSLHSLIVERAGRNASSDYLGEHITQVQEIYGSGGDVATHLGFAYLERRFFGGRVGVAAGHLAVGQEFAVSPLYCEFLTLSVCPNPGGLLAQPGFTTFVNSTWGTRLRWQVADPLTIKAGAFQVRPEAGGRSGFDFSTNHTSGGLFAIEAEFVPILGAAGLVGHYKAGGIYYTGKVLEFPPSANVDGGSSQFHRGQASWYVLADQVLKRPRSDGSGVVVVYAGYTWEDGHTSLIGQNAFAGVLTSGAIPSRPKDNVGFQVSWLKISDQLAAAQALQSAAGVPLSSGLPTPGLSPPGPQSSELIFEARYDVRVIEGFHAVGDVQYVVRPNATDRIRNALVLALRTKIDF